ncbi:MAG: hypothetical protein HW380_1858 [Magnetococcales bacterium]|nr:hypothetical protein [Magnetococcales bacterium]HIJ85292.1 insulinase family protein [Magnetococcales bacterium]
MNRWIFFLMVVVGWFPAVSFGETTLADARFFQTGGGIRVYLLENHANPMVEVNILTRGGSAYDPAGKAGVASLTAWMFNEGAGDMDAETFRGRLDFFGISMDGDANRDTLVVKMTTLSEHFEEALRLLALALTQPRFELKNLERAQRERIVELKQHREQAGWLAGLQLYSMMFAGHPYGHPTSGTEESVGRITLNDVRQFHAKSFRAPEMVMAVAGDVTQPVLVALLDRFLGGLDSRPSPHGKIPLAPQSEKGGEFHVEMDTSQTAIQMGVVAMDREDPDYYPLLVLGQAFGGSGLTSRLYVELREKRGLTYGVHSMFLPLKERGPFMVALNTKTASVADAVQLIRDEMRRMAAEGLKDEELLDVKRYLTGSFALNLDTLKKQAATWSLIGYYRRGMDYLRRWPERIQAVSGEDVKRVARRVLEPERFSTVTVGKTVGGGKTSDP